MVVNILLNILSCQHNLGVFIFLIPLTTLNILGVMYNWVCKREIKIYKGGEGKVGVES